MAAAGPDIAAKLAELKDPNNGFKRRFESLLVLREAYNQIDSSIFAAGGNHESTNKFLDEWVNYLNDLAILEATNPDHHANINAYFTQYSNYLTKNHDDLELWAAKDRRIITPTAVNLAINSNSIIVLQALLDNATINYDNDVLEAIANNGQITHTMAIDIANKATDLKVLTKLLQNPAVNASEDVLKAIAANVNITPEIAIGMAKNATDPKVLAALLQNPAINASEDVLKAIAANVNITPEIAIGMAIKATNQIVLQELLLNANVESVNEVLKAIAQNSNLSPGLAGFTAGKAKDPEVLLALLKNDTVNYVSALIFDIATHNNSDDPAVRAALAAAIAGAATLADQKLAAILQIQNLNKDVAIIAAVIEHGNFAEESFGKLPAKNQEELRTAAENTKDVEQAKKLANTNDKAIILALLKNSQKATNKNVKINQDNDVLEAIGASSAAIEIARKTADVAKAIVLINTGNVAIMANLELLRTGPAKRFTGTKLEEVKAAIEEAIKSIVKDPYATTKQVNDIVQHFGDYDNAMSMHDNLELPAAIMLAARGDEAVIANLMSHREVNTFLTDPRFITAIVSNKNADAAALTAMLKSKAGAPLATDADRKLIAGHRNLNIEIARELVAYCNPDTFTALLARTTGDVTYAVLLADSAFVAAATRNVNPAVQNWGILADKNPDADQVAVLQAVQGNVGDHAIYVLAAGHDNLNLETALILANSNNTKVIKILLAHKNIATFLADDTFRAAVSQAQDQLAKDMAILAAPASSAAELKDVIDNNHVQKYDSLAASHQHLQLPEALTIAGRCTNDAAGHAIILALIEHKNRFLDDPDFRDVALAKASPADKIKIARIIVADPDSKPEQIKAAINANPSPPDSMYDPDIDVKASLHPILDIADAIMLAGRGNTVVLNNLFVDPDPAAAAAAAARMALYPAVAITPKRTLNFLSDPGFRSAVIKNAVATNEQRHLAIIWEPTSDAVAVREVVLAGSNDLQASIHPKLDVATATMLAARPDTLVLHHLLDHNTNFSADYDFVLAVLRNAVSHITYNDLGSPAAKLARKAQSLPILELILKDAQANNSPEVLDAIARNTLGKIKNVQQEIKVALLEILEKSVAAPPGVLPIKLDQSDILLIINNPAADAKVLQKILDTQNSAKDNIYLLVALRDKGFAVEEVNEALQKCAQDELVGIRQYFDKLGTSSKQEKLNGLVNLHIELQDNLHPVVRALLPEALAEIENKILQQVDALYAENMQIKQSKIEKGSDGELELLNQLLELLGSEIRSNSALAAAAALQGSKISKELHELEARIEQLSTEQGLTLDATGDAAPNGNAPPLKQDPAQPPSVPIDSRLGNFDDKKWMKLLKEIHSRIPSANNPVQVSGDPNHVVFSFPKDKAPNSLHVQRSEQGTVSVKADKPGYNKNVVSKFIEVAKAAAAASAGSPQNIHLRGGDAQTILEILEGLKIQIGKTLTISFTPELYNSFNGANKGKIDIIMNELGIRAPGAQPLGEPPPRKLQLPTFPPDPHSGLSGGQQPPLRPGRQDEGTSGRLEDDATHRPDTGAPGPGAPRPS